MNDLKTSITELPEPLEPSWKTALRNLEIKRGDGGTSIRVLFDRGFELAKEFPQDSVLTYIAKKLRNSQIDPADWEITEVSLLRAAFGEPSLLQILPEIYQNNGQQKSGALKVAIENLCVHHSRLHQSSEVAWALWIAKLMNIQLSRKTAQLVTSIDDDIVALVALDLYHSGLLPRVNFDLWSAHLSASGLYSDHWLLAYEAYEQRWLRPISRADYIASEPTFEILRRHDVRFYDIASNLPLAPSPYGDEVDDVEPERAALDFTDLLLLRGDSGSSS
jgi:hypothetical protein